MEGRSALVVLGKRVSWPWSQDLMMAGGSVDENFASELSGIVPHEQFPFELLLIVRE